VARVRANCISLPKAEGFSSKDNPLASVKTTQLHLLNCSDAVVYLREDPDPWALLIFNTNATRFCYCALGLFSTLFSPAVGKVNLNVHCKWWLISVLCYNLLVFF